MKNLFLLLLLCAVLWLAPASGAAVVEDQPDWIWESSSCLMAAEANCTKRGLNWACMISMEIDESYSRNLDPVPENLNSIQLYTINSTTTYREYRKQHICPC